MMDLISVIIPAYNAEKYIKKCLSSIISQTYDTLEIIVIDDGSTDCTYKICREFSLLDKRVNVISRENKGLIATLNELLSLAKGNYIARMDADDISHPNRIFLQHEFLSKNDYAFCGSSIVEIDEMGSPLKNIDLTMSDSLLESKSLFGPAFYHPSVMFRRDKCRKQLFYSKDAHLVEDFELWSRLLSKGIKGQNVPERLLYYRIHESSVSVSNNDAQNLSKSFLVQKNLVDRLGLTLELANLVANLEKNISRSLFYKINLLLKVLRCLCLNNKGSSSQIKLYLYSYLLLLKRVFR